MRPKARFLLRNDPHTFYEPHQDEFLIGRSKECGIVLSDPRVSRVQARVRFEHGNYFIENLGKNPTLVNGLPAKGQILKTDDLLRLGRTELLFRVEEKDVEIPVRPPFVQETIVAPSPQKTWLGPGLAVWSLVAVLLIALAGYVLYGKAYRPWKVRRTLESVSEQIASGSYLPAQEVLKRLLETNLPAKEAEKAKKLLSQSTLGVVQGMVEKENLQEAKAYLVTHLRDYGGGEEANALWEKLDLVRLSLGQAAESREEYQVALREYAAIREDSPWFDDAQKGIRRIWLAYQQKRFERETKGQLLKKAEEHFLAKRYLTPVNRNAYTAYQAVLALDPANALAHQRLGQMKAFYRKHGGRYLKIQDWSKALTYLERYSIIDPDDPDIKAKLNICRKKLDIREPEVGESRDQETASYKQQDRIKRLPEESETKSAWIMKFLFEEKGGEKQAKTPW